MAQAGWMRVGVVVVALASLLAFAGTPAAHAGGSLPPCPQLEGWVGPTQSGLSFSDEGGGRLACYYTPGPGTSLPSTTEAYIEANWVGDAEPAPGAVMTASGCDRTVPPGDNYRVESSAGYWAAITYGISGAGSQSGPILVAEEGRFLQSVAVLMPAVEPYAQSCTEEVEGQLDYPTNRTAGTNRYETATEISSLWGSTSVVYVATGQNFPDALGGGPAAAIDSGLILLVERDAIPATTAAELSRLNPLRIVVLGGTGAISDGVVAGLGAYADTVDRVAGLNRYETAVAVSAYAFPDPSAVSSVFVATGRSFADPIIAGAAAALADAPLLLVDGVAPLESVVRAELERLAPLSIVLVGSDADVGNVAGELGAIAPVTRINQSDVYARSAALYDGAAAGVAEVVLATSSAFADALAGTPYAAADPVSYLMLSRPDCIPAVVHAQIDRLAPGNVKLLGGTAALSPAVESLTSC